AARLPGRRVRALSGLCAAAPAPLWTRTPLAAGAVLAEPGGAMRIRRRRVACDRSWLSRGRSRRKPILPRMSRENDTGFEIAAIPSVALALARRGADAAGSALTGADGGSPRRVRRRPGASSRLNAGQRDRVASQREGTR